MVMRNIKNQIPVTMKKQLLFLILLLLSLDSFSQKVMEQIFLDDKIEIGPVDGKRLLKPGEGTFIHVGKNFKWFSLNNVEVPIKDSLSVRVYALAEDTMVTFKQMFLEIDNNPDNLVMSRHQIIRFCQKYIIGNLDDTTLFLMKKKDAYFVITATRGFLGFDINAFKFNSKKILDTNSVVVVVPAKNKK
jgi:hypothetical protein